ncbi:mitochondrial fission ELM1 family protein [Myxococcota bacterium]|nr:mitochondrial fission ELM1 family protein [Myxococcota bacterium]
MDRQTHNRDTCLTECGDLIELKPHANAPASMAPTVVIYALTAPGLESADRVFLWSIASTRNPLRHYQIHLVRGVPGFPPDRLGNPSNRLGLALPQLGACGQVLVNRVDQVYTQDPAELFDMELAPFALLTPSEADAGIILMDAERCIGLWSLDRVRQSPPADLLALAAGREHILGRLPLKASRREQDSPTSGGGILRFDTPQYQPWRPFPERVVYRDGPGADYWRRLENAAEAARFQPFDEHHPSRAYQSWRDAPSQPSASLRKWLHPARDPALRDALARAGAQHVRVLALDTESSDLGMARRALEDAWQTHIDDIRDPRVDGWAAGEISEGVILPGGLETIPAADRAWVLDALGSQAERLVHVAWRSRDRPDGRELERAVQAAARRHPQLSWLSADFGQGRRVRLARAGQRLNDGPPRVWVLADNRAGNTSQSLGLASRLDWPFQVKHLGCGPLSVLQNRILGASRAGTWRKRTSRLDPPWPDLVIAAGRRTAPVARWIQKQNLGLTRLVQLGRKGGDDADPFDLVCTPRYAQLFEHPKREITSAPLHSMTPARLAEAAERWRPRLEQRGRGRPWITVLLGGSSSQYRLTPDVARALGRDVVAMARARGGSVLATTSRRAGDTVCEAFCSQLREVDSVYRWTPNADPNDNPYAGLLALADTIVVTADSESMLSEATAVGCPVYVYPLPERTSGGVGPIQAWPRMLLRSLRHFILQRATRERPDPSGGIAAPSWLEHRCARWIEQGWSRPTRDLSRLHEDLFARGLAKPFGAPFGERPLRGDIELNHIAQRVAELVAPASDSGEKPTRSPSLSSTRA